MGINMRIIAGKYRGTKLYTLEGLDTRPTLDRVKEPLFSILQSKLLKANVLDLFAGSGALSLESLSRGAERVVLCDNSKKAINVIKQNFEKLKIVTNFEIINKDYIEALKNLQNEKFDIIFLDPPYNMHILNDILNFISINKLLTKDGIVICEIDKEYLEDINDLELIKNKRYGSTFVYIYKITQ